MTRVKEKYPDVRLIFTDSWEYTEGYIGDYVYILKDKKTNDFTIRKKVWWQTVKPPIYL